MRNAAGSNRLSMALMALFALGTAGYSVAAPPPGPPWPVNYPLPQVRPASDAPQKDFAFAEVEASGAPIGVAVTFAGAVAKPAMGNKYDLYYQFRIHTKKGEYGPVLGTPEKPTGRAFFIRQISCEYDWIEFYEKIDVTRRDISGMLNLPAVAPGEADSEVIIRVEPQLYDVTAKKFLTPPKTLAAILVATVGTGGRVFSLQSLSSWLIEKSTSGSDVKSMLQRVADLDDFITIANHMEAALETVLKSKDVPTERKVLYIHAVPAGTLKTSLVAYNLKSLLEGFAAGTDADLKAAAQKKLDEAK